MSKKFFIHDSSYVDDNVQIGTGTKIWHFSHIQSGSNIGRNLKQINLAYPKKKLTFIEVNKQAYETCLLISIFIMLYFKLLYRTRISLTLGFVLLDFFNPPNEAKKVDGASSKTPG